ncbi:MAG: hypothetical protein IT437_00010 [Phycisphaerales bacterium]|nr:hypothetical protein [Phycisphaerales bacterium]
MNTTGHAAAAGVPAAVWAVDEQNWFVTGRSFNAFSLDNCVTAKYHDQDP